MSSRRISTGIAGRNVLGSIVAVNNSLQSVVNDENVVLQANGTGISVSTTAFQINSGNSLRLADSDSSNFIALQAPATVASNVTLTFPATAGSNTQVLSTDGNGVLSWVSSNISITNQVASSNTFYPMLSASDSGTISGASVSNNKLTYQPSSGTLTATALVESSSIALKENITPIENALDSILKLTGVLYDRKDGSAKNEAGLIAEDVNKILPNLVTKDKDGNPYGINYTKFSAYIIEAIKTLKEDINTLKQNEYKLNRGTYNG